MNKEFWLGKLQYVNERMRREYGIKMGVRRTVNA
jgi:hypothetical protein